MKLLVKNLLIVIASITFLLSQGQTLMNVYQNNGSVIQIPLSTIDSITYTIGNPGNPASFNAIQSIENVTANAATCDVTIYDDGGSQITERGICWNTSPNPTTANYKTNDGVGIGDFTSAMSGLSANTIYYVRAYAINSAGTAYSNQISFVTNGGNIVSSPGPGVASNGYNYSTIVLGNGQEWMAENLRTSFYANGDPIPNVTNGSQWSTLNTGAWVYYNHDSQYNNPYGKLYNWYAVADSRNICPLGWHVPSDGDWNNLIEYLDPSYDPNGISPQSSIAGGKLKLTVIQYWQTPNSGATNEIGFSAHPGGMGDYWCSFSQLNGYANFWTSTEDNTNPSYAWYRMLFYNYGKIDRNSIWKQGAFSVRCIKD